MVFLTIKHFHSMILFKSCRMETKDDLAVSDSTETVGLNVTTTGARALSLCDTDIHGNFGKPRGCLMQVIEIAWCQRVVHGW